MDTVHPQTLVEVAGWMGNVLSSCRTCRAPAHPSEHLTFTFRGSPREEPALSAGSFVSSFSYQTHAIFPQLEHTLF